MNIIRELLLTDPSANKMNIAGVAPPSMPESAPSTFPPPYPQAAPKRQAPTTTTPTTNGTSTNDLPVGTLSSDLPGFPSLVPAIVTKVNIGDVNDLGIIHNGSKLTHFGTPSGTIESVPGFEPAFKATVNFGADWLSFDPDGKHARINLKGMARTESGQSIDFRYKGVIKMAPDVCKIFEFKPDMATVPFGYATGAHTFLVADPALKDLENSTFVSNGRIIVTPEGLIVETRQSKVVPANVMN